MCTQMIVKIFRHELYRPHAPNGTISSSYTFQLNIGITVYIDPLIRLFDCGYSVTWNSYINNKSLMLA